MCTATLRICLMQNNLAPPPPLFCEDLSYRKRSTLPCDHMYVNLFHQGWMGGMNERQDGLVKVLTLAFVERQS